MEYKFKVGDRVQPSNAVAGDEKYQTITRRYQYKGQPLYCLRMGTARDGYCTEKSVEEQALKLYKHE